MKNVYEKLNMAIEQIEGHLFEEPDMKKINQILELNTNVSNSIFELFTGYTIKDYIRKRRLSEAALLIRIQKITDIAFSCGYDSREGFSRAYKAFHGHSPSSKTAEFCYLSKIHFDEMLLSYPVKKIRYEDVKGTNDESK